MFAIQKFVKERDKTLLSLNERKIRRLMKKHGMWFRPGDEISFWATVHKAILGISYATEEQKERSAKWLTEHGFTASIM